MSAGKSLDQWGVLLKGEASYGAGATVAAASDGLLVMEQPTVEPLFAHEGERRGTRGPMNQGIANVGKTGLHCNPTLIHEAAGFGAAYSATDVPSPHVLLLAAGLYGTVVVTAGSETWTYAPGVPTSAGGEIYTREQKYTLKGIYADLSIESDGPDVPVWTFPLWGILTQPDEAAVPSITSYNVIVPPKSAGITLNIGDFTAGVIRSWGFALNRAISPRLDQNASDGHAGFHLGGIDPILTVSIEAAEFASSPYHEATKLNPYQLAAAATGLAISLDLGSVQYKKWVLVAAQAQLQTPDESEDEGAAIWDLTFKCAPSAPHLLDGFSILFD